MSRDVEGLIVSFAFVFAMIFIATLSQYIVKISNESSRKIIHISVGNWIFFALHYFTDWYIAIIGPVTFIVLNIISYNAKIFKAMELEDKNPGTIYYPISLTVCTFFAFSQPQMLVLPYLGIMAMTWGDGFAAVVGKKWPLRKVRANRSLGGSITFFVVTFVAALIYLIVTAKNIETSSVILFSLGAALLGTVIEIFSPKNLDNLTVPIILGIIGFLIGV